MIALLYALGSNISFASASIYFTKFGLKSGPAWMNYYKSIIAFSAFLFLNLILGSQFQINSESFWLLCISGILGLTIGDIFLIRAFTELGSGRVLMIFGFEPLMLGIFGFFMFGESLTVSQILAILFLVLCLLSFSWESKKHQGHWGIRGLIFALVGVGLDISGVVLTKKAMNLSPQMGVFELNLVRTGVTALSFWLWSMLPRTKLSIGSELKRYSKRELIEVTIASFMGTFMSLSFYMQAVKLGPIATVSAIAGTSPLFATTFEIIRGTRKATPQLLLAIVCFISGVGLLIFG